MYVLASLRDLWEFVELYNACLLTGSEEECVISIRKGAAVQCVLVIATS